MCLSKISPVIICQQCQSGCFKLKKAGWRLTPMELVGHHSYFCNRLGDSCHRVLGLGDCCWQCGSSCHNDLWNQMHWIISGLYHFFAYIPTTDDSHFVQDKAPKPQSSTLCLRILVFIAAFTSCLSRTVPELGWDLLSPIRSTSVDLAIQQTLINTKDSSKQALALIPTFPKLIQILKNHRKFKKTVSDVLHGSH